MHIISKKTVLSFLFFSAALLNVSAQDLLARQAPTDRRLKAVDSVALRQLQIKENTLGANFSENDLYTTWNTSGVHVYGKQNLPESYKIDLRNFVMPTPSRNVTSHYGYRRQFGRNHLGLDIKVYTGDTIVSAWDGKVRVVKYEPSGWGRYVVVRHANGLETLYAHLSKQIVEVDQVVKAGEPIGLGGNTGRSTGSHLHLECRLLGEPINPELLFDFPNQDMTGDYYVWHNDGNSHRRDVNYDIASAERQAEEDLAIMASGTTPQQIAQRETAAPKARYHKVKKGDSAFSIAQKVGISVDQLLKANGLSKRSKLHPGQLLKY